MTDRFKVWIGDEIIPINPEKVRFHNLREDARLGDTVLIRTESTVKLALYVEQHRAANNRYWFRSGNEVWEAPQPRRAKDGSYTRAEKA